MDDFLLYCKNSTWYYIKMNRINKIAKENCIQTFLSKKNVAMLYLRFVDTYIELKINKNATID